jgi:hypothetical protein
VLFPTVHAKYPELNSFIGSTNLSVRRSQLLACPFTLLAAAEIVSDGFKLIVVNTSVELLSTSSR